MECLSCPNEIPKLERENWNPIISPFLTRHSKVQAAFKHYLGSKGFRSCILGPPNRELKVKGILKGIYNRLPLIMSYSLDIDLAL